MTQYIRTENGPLHRITTVGALRTAFQGIEVQDAARFRKDESDTYGTGYIFERVEKPRIPLQSFVKAEQALRDAGYVLVKIEEADLPQIDCDLCPGIFTSVQAWRNHNKTEHPLDHDLTVAQ